MYKTLTAALKQFEPIVEDLGQGNPEAWPVVCLRGGKRGAYLGPPFWAPLRCFAGTFFSFLMKNSIIHSYYIYTPKHMISTVPCFQRGPQQQL